MSAEKGKWDWPTPWSGTLQNPQKGPSEGFEGGPPSGIGVHHNPASEAAMPSMAVTIAETTAGMQRGRPFQPGQSGNPAGRPKGARNRATVAAEALLAGEAEALTRKAVELALAGDVTALRLCLERVVPPRKDRAVAFDLPAVVKADDAAQALGAVLAAVADSTITPSEAVALAGLIEAQRRAIGLEVAQPATSQLNIRFVSPEGRPGDFAHSSCRATIEGKR